MRRRRRMATGILLSLAMILTTLTGVPMPSVSAESEVAQASELETAEAEFAEASEPEFAEEKAAKAGANATTIFVAGKEGSGYLESGYGYYWEQDWIYDSGYTALKNGQTIWQDRGQGSHDNEAYAKFTYGSDYSTLELNGYLTYDSVGYVKVADDTVEDEDEREEMLYGIYYEGNLKLIINGKCRLWAKRYDTFSKVYGIYVTGDLIIESGWRDSALFVDMHRAGSTNVTDTSYGIYCGGTLTIRSETNDLEVNASAGDVRDKYDMGGVRSYGVYCNKYAQTSGSLTANGGNILIGDQNLSYGLFVSDNYAIDAFVISGGYVRGVAGNTMGEEEYSGSKGIYVGGPMTISGGTVKGYAGGALKDSEGIEAKRLQMTGGELSGSGTLNKSSSLSYGIYLRETGCDITGGTVTGTAGLAEGSAYGIYCKGFKLPAGSTASVVAKGLDASYGKIGSNYGIYVGNSGSGIKVEDGSVYASSGDAVYTSDAIYSSWNQVSASGNGKITAVGGNCDDRSEGILAKSLLCEGQGVIEATVGKSEGNISTGIFTIDDMTVTGGTVRAKAAEGGKGSYGMWINIGCSALRISGGTTECEGETGGFYGNYQAYFGKVSIKVTGGKLIARGKTGSAISSNGDTLSITTPYMKGSVNYDGSGAAPAETYDPAWHYAMLSGAYIVSFDENGGAGTMESVTVPEGENYVLPACGFTAPSGYTFAGWGVNGSGNLCAPGDVIEVNANLTLAAIWWECSEPLEIKKQPRDWYGDFGKKATFTVEAVGDDLSYQWQYKKSGNWLDYGVTTADTATFKVTMNEKNIKWPIRCVITDAYGQQVITREVHLKDASVSAPITITKQPVDYTGVLGKKANFTVEAAGNGLTYQWQYKKGTKWKPYTVASATTTTLKVTMNEVNVTYPIRCKITDEDGFIAYTNEVAMKIKEAEPLTITKQPVDWTGNYGQKASFSVVATGEGLSYQWQYKKGTAAWTDYAIATADTANFKVTMNEKNVKWTYRCVITDAKGNTVTSNEVYMKLKTEEPVPEGITITSEPGDWYGNYGQKASFNVTATGEGLTYQWQYKKGTAAWTDYAIATADTANFKVTMNEKNVKWTFRCVITDANGNTVTTNEVRMVLSE